LGSAAAFKAVHGIDLVREAEWQWDISVNEGLAK
jgi:hypothetical protein